MNSHAQVQIIERDGRPEYAVVPFDDYKRLLALAEDAEEIRLMIKRCMNWITVRMS